MFNAKVLADSIADHGVRLTTLEITYPRFIHSELMTHRAFSRNAASSRAVPIAKVIEQVKTNPAMPVWWGKQQPGMQAVEQLTGAELEQAQAEWLAARDHAVVRAQRMASTNLHKQITNRILEPWVWITVIVTATDWANFFALRAHPDAQPEIQHLAGLMQSAIEESTPALRTLGFDSIGDWHLPLIQADEIENTPLEELRKISVARCARVSYLTHDGVRDHAKDLELYERLLNGSGNGHWSPFEHVATPLGVADQYSGNFRGWFQFRKQFDNECVKDSSFEHIEVE